jgi:hypothetical protein
MIGGVTDDWFAGSKVAFTLLRWCDRLYWMCLACSLCYWQRRWWRRRWWCLVYSHTTIGIRLIKLVTIHTCIRDSCFCSFVSFISFTGQTVAGSRSFWLFPCICRDDEIGLDFPLIQTIPRERWTEVMNRTTRHSQCSFALDPIWSDSWPLWWPLLYWYWWMNSIIQALSFGRWRMTPMDDPESEWPRWWTLNGWWSQWEHVAPSRFAFIGSSFSSWIQSNNDCTHAH